MASIMAAASGFCRWSWVHLDATEDLVDIADFFQGTFPKVSERGFIDGNDGLEATSLIRGSDMSTFL